MILFLNKEDFAFLHKGNVVGHMTGSFGHYFGHKFWHYSTAMLGATPSSPPLPFPFPPLPLYTSARRAPKFPPSLLAPQTGSKTVPVLDSVKDSLEKLLRAPMARLKDQKADQKRLSPGTSFGDRSLQRFRLHRGGPQVSAHSIQILQPNSVPMRGGRRRILTDILQRHAPPRHALHQVCLK